MTRLRHAEAQIPSALLQSIFDGRGRNTNLLTRVHLSHFIDELGRELPKIGGNLQAHEARDIAHPGVTVVQSGVPQRRFVLSIPDMSDDPAVLGLTQRDTESCRYVLLFEITITGSRARRDWHHVTNHPWNWAFCGWTEPRDLIWGELAHFPIRVQSTMNQERVAITGSVSGTKLNEISAARLLS
jgi:hypothetical protein